MSGGSLNYFYCQLQDHVGDFGDKELDELVKDLAELFHDREWYLSGDTGEGNWIESRDKFKAKWFTEHGRQERIEKYLAEIGNEVRAMFGMSKKCHTCKHWERESECYGKCEFISGCLKHRSESYWGKSSLDMGLAIFGKWRNFGQSTGDIEEKVKADVASIVKIFLKGTEHLEYNIEPALDQLNDEIRRIRDRLLKCRRISRYDMQDDFKRRTIT